MLNVPQPQPLHRSHNPEVSVACDTKMTVPTRDECVAELVAYLAQHLVSHR